MKRLAFLRTLLAIPLAGCMPKQWHGDALPVEPDTTTDNATTVGGRTYTYYYSKQRRVDIEPPRHTWTTP
jgi:hypothetical protein|tara:strand:- start:718 stop:927 length:210 start_codon:yes stop_codon:yes gene_type:complete